MKQIRHVSGFHFEGTRSARVPHDLFICALGYESRATHAASELGETADRRIAIGFDYHHCGQLAENQKWFEERGFLDWKKKLPLDWNPPFLSDENFNLIVGSLLERILSNPSDRILRVCIDISCFSMVRLACLLEAVACCDRRGVISVDFVYSSGAGYDGLREPRQIEIAEPVTDRYAGWTVEPDLPVHAVFGLGLEYDKAVGAIELLNPADAFAFATLGSSKAMDDQLTEANRLFFPLIDQPKRFCFSIDRPMELYNRLWSLTQGIMRQARPVFVPIGPKLFGVASLLIAEISVPQVSVWRISTGRSGVPLDITATGPINGFSVLFDDVE